MAKKFKKKIIAIIGVIAGALLGGVAVNLFGNQAVYGVPDTQYNREEAYRMAFNAKFESYEGLGIKGSSIKNLIDVLRTNNASAIYENDQIVTFNGISNIEELSNIRTTINLSKKYNISYEYDNDGFVKNIICEEVK